MSEFLDRKPQRATKKETTQLTHCMDALLDAHGELLEGKNGRVAHFTPLTIDSGGFNEHLGVLEVSVIHVAVEASDKKQGYYFKMYQEIGQMVGKMSVTIHDTIFVPTKGKRLATHERTIQWVDGDDEPLVAADMPAYDRLAEDAWPAGKHHQAGRVAHDAIIQTVQADFDSKKLDIQAYLEAMDLFGEITIHDVPSYPHDPSWNQ